MNVYFKTIFSLGLLNVLRVVKYRFWTKKWLFLTRPPQIDSLEPPFFTLPKRRLDLMIQSNWNEEMTLFGCHRFPISSAPPDWFKNYIQNKKMKNVDIPWWKIPDYSQETGDIKAIWELSRFDWTLAFSQKALTQSSEKSIEQLNFWLSDWIKKNPPYTGPNWKCAQECSLRVINLACSAIILEQHKKTSTALL
jgi:hypothetical protein